MRRAVTKHGANPADVSVDSENARSDQETLIAHLKTREEFAFADHEEYMKWYRWWNEWHKHTLTEEQWKQLDNILRWDGTQNEETFKDWRPSGSWRETPA